MPCDSSGYPASGTDHEAQKEIKWLKKELDSVTSMLCQLIGSVDTISRYDLPPDLKKWYEEHRKWDKSQGR